MPVLLVLRNMALKFTMGREGECEVTARSFLAEGEGVRAAAVPQRCRVAAGRSAPCPCGPSGQLPPKGRGLSPWRRRPANPRRGRAWPRRLGPAPKGFLARRGAAPARRSAAVSPRRVPKTQQLGAQPARRAPGLGRRNGPTARVAQSGPWWWPRLNVKARRQHHVALGDNAVLWGRGCGGVRCTGQLPAQHLCQGKRTVSVILGKLASFLL